jgi:hypothetical protein
MIEVTCACLHKRFSGFASVFIRKENLPESENVKGTVNIQRLSGVYMSVLQNFRASSQMLRKNKRECFIQVRFFRLV